jgi:hypothetical protein
VLKTDSIQITPEVLNLIARIDEFKGAWRALGTLAPDRLSALRRVATIESIGSSTRIEGSKLSDREVEQLLSNLEIKSFATRDEQEVAGYAELMDLVFSSWQDIPFHRKPPKAVAPDPAAPQREGRLASRPLQDQFEQRRGLRRIRRPDRYRVSDRVAVRHPPPDDGTGDLGEALERETGPAASLS